MSNDAMQAFIWFILWANAREHSVLTKCADRLWNKIASQKSHSDSVRSGLEQLGLFGLSCNVFAIYLEAVVISQEGSVPIVATVIPVIIDAGVPALMGHVAGESITGVVDVSMIADPIPELKFGASEVALGIVADFCNRENVSFRGVDRLP